MSDSRDQFDHSALQETLGDVPAWVYRSGLLTILAVLCLLAALAWTIRYPDMIVGEILITTADAPSGVYSKATGPLSLWVEERQHVKKGDALGMIQNGTPYKQAAAVRQFLTTVTSSGAAEWQALTPPNLTNLGQLQAGYTEFLQAWREHLYNVDSAYYQDSIDKLRSQQQHLAALNLELEAQKKIKQKELEIELVVYESNRELYEQNILSKVKFARVEADYFGKQTEVKEIEVRIINNNLKMEELDERLITLQEELKRTSFTGVQEIDQSARKLLGQIKLWEETFVLRAPENGGVRLYRFWDDNQNVKAGDEVLTLVPDALHLIGRMGVSAVGVGKIAPEQRVLVKLDGYHFAEFGVIEGRVSKITEVPRDGQYIVDVSFPQGLQQNAAIDFRQEMSGSGEIITRDYRLVERIFFVIRSAFERQRAAGA